MNRNIYSSGARGAFGQRDADRSRRAAPAFSRAISYENGGQMMLAMAYVPNQSFKNLYSPSDGLGAGTLFAELNMPYCTGGRR